MADTGTALAGDPAAAAAAAAAPGGAQPPSGNQPDPGAVSRDPNGGAPAADPVAAEAAKAEALTAAEKALTEAKTPEEKAAAEAKLKELKGEAKTGAPEKYEDFKLPDGLQLDKARLEAFTPLAKELNLSQEQAQKLVDFQASFVKEQAEKHVADWNKLLETRLAETKADKDIGGANFERSIADARTFLKEFGTPALQEWLGAAEAGSHVELIRAFAKAGRALADDKFVPASGGPTGGEPKSLAERMYPNHK